MYKCLSILLILLAFCFLCFAQKNELYTQHYNGGLCSTNIKLFEDSTYEYESGCEGRSSVSFGTWSQKKDTIQFTQADTRNFKILKIDSSTTNGAKKISVRIFNQNGENITEQIKIGQYCRGKGFYSMDLDNDKTSKTDYFRDSGIIIIESLERLLNEKSEIIVGHSTHLDITLNIPTDLIYKIKANWINLGDFKLLKVKNKLKAIDYRYDDDSDFIKVE
jgi:hypothetical protein